MNASLEATGERMIEESYRKTLGGQAIFLMHLASYEFVIDMCRGKRVLDLGCGSGYGAAQVSEVASSVHAVDVSAEAVAYAETHYPRDNVRYSVIVAGEKLPFPDSQFDVVLSFQVLEHVDDDAAYLAEACRVLRADGELVLITPDRRHRLWPGQRPWNRWHVREYGARQLADLMSRSFSVQRLLHMEADTVVSGIELRRYRVMKWATLPFTFPGSPEWLRQWGLGLLHRFRPKRPVDDEPAADPSIGTGSVRFVDSARRSLNLLVVARPGATPGRAS